MHTTHIFTTPTLHYPNVLPVMSQSFKILENGFLFIFSLSQKSLVIVRYIFRNVTLPKYIL